MRITCIVLVASLSIVPTELLAQRCMGGGLFADRRAQIGADAALTTAGRSASGRLSVGTRRGPFASVGLGTTHNDDVNDDATLFTAIAGFGIPLQPRPTTQLCPFLAAVVTNGMASNDTVIFGEHRSPIRSLSSLAYGVGASVGTAVSSVTAFELVPFASAAVMGRTTTIYTGGPTDGAGDHYYAVSFGAGAIVDKLITLRPSLTLTFAGGRTHPSYGLYFSLNFGHVTPRRPVGEGEGSLTTVWLNTQVGVYYCPGSTSYGATPQGAFVTEREALAGGAAPAQGRRC